MYCIFIHFHFDSKFPSSEEKKNLKKQKTNGKTLDRQLPVLHFSRLFDLFCDTHTQ